MLFRSRRIILLCHAGAVPPPDLPAILPSQAPWLCEAEILTTLRGSGHQLQVVGLTHDFAPLRKAVTDFRPHLIFNLAEAIHGDFAFERHVAAYLEVLGVPFTGSPSRAIALAGDKAIAKSIFNQHAIATPRYAVVPSQTASTTLRSHLADCDFLTSENALRFPLFIKSVSSDASLGISQSSIVKSMAQLEKRLHYIHQRLGTAALLEQYIEGREIGRAHD